MYEIISLLYKSTQRFSMIIKPVNLVCKIAYLYYMWWQGVNLASEKDLRNKDKLVVCNKQLFD